MLKKENYIYCTFLDLPIMSLRNNNLFYTVSVLNGKMKILIHSVQCAVIHELYTCVSINKICFLQENIEHLCSELKNPKYGVYYLCKYHFFVLVSL